MKEKRVPFIIKLNKMETTIPIPENGQQDDEQFRTWETNHQKILTAIGKVTIYAETNYLPTITELSRLTGLSRKCIYEHLHRSSTHPACLQRSEIFNSMEPEILLKIALKAMKGDLQAAKLYLQLTGKIEGKASANKSIVNNIVIFEDINTGSQFNTHNLNLYFKWQLSTFLIS